MLTVLTDNRDYSLLSENFYVSKARGGFVGFNSKLVFIQLLAYLLDNNVVQVHGLIIES